MSVAPLVPERDFRRPGCGDGCHVVKALIPGVFGRSELMLHDPEPHEQYGRMQSRTIVRLGHEIETGPLVVDIARGEARLTGQPLVVTATEWKLLTVLGRQIGVLVEHDEIIRAVWGVEWIVTNRPAALHNLRIVTARLRTKLGRAAGLLVTVPYLGFRLDALAADQLPEPWPVHYRSSGIPLPPGQWSRRYQVCLGCGTAEYAYARRGYCRRWRCVQQAIKVKDQVRAAARAGQSVTRPLAATAAPSGEAGA